MSKQNLFCSWKLIFYCNLGDPEAAKSQIPIFGYSSVSGKNSPSITMTPRQSWAALPGTSPAQTQQRGQQFY